MNIEEYIMSKEWKFGELLQLTETSKRVAEELYEEIAVIDMINNLWSKRIEVADGISFGQLYKNLAMEYLTQEVMDAFKNTLNLRLLVLTHQLYYRTKKKLWKNYLYHQSQKR